ncbi:hypothetical protein LEQ04_07235 [Riemerella anatipestifer]|nr:hypothetical protein LEQ04_07235 [Riemerella anatipestifer]
MKNLISILATFLFCFNVSAQNNSQLIKKQKNISIEQSEFQSICISIKQIIEEYDCDNFRNKKFYLRNESEELIIFIKNNRKIRISYESTNPNDNILIIKYDKILKILDE